AATFCRSSRRTAAVVEPTCPCVSLTTAMRMGMSKSQIRMTKETQSPKQQNTQVRRYIARRLPCTRRLSRVAYIVAPGGRQADRPAADLHVLFLICDLRSPSRRTGIRISTFKRNPRLQEKPGRGDSGSVTQLLLVSRRAPGGFARLARRGRAGGDRGRDVVG